MAMPVSMIFYFQVAKAFGESMKLPAGQLHWSPVHVKPYPATIVPAPSRFTAGLSIVVLQRVLHASFTVVAEPVQPDRPQSMG